MRWLDRLSNYMYQCINWWALLNYISSAITLWSIEIDDPIYCTRAVGLHPTAFGLVVVQVKV